jgi:carboxylate-amine ligase
MTAAEPLLTLGIEEEYLLVDPATRELATDPPASILRDCRALIGEKGGAVAPEFLRAQIEVGTPVCRSIGEARAHIVHLRGCVAAAAKSAGVGADRRIDPPFCRMAQPAPDRP